MKYRTFLIVLSIILSISSTQGQNNYEVQIPKFDDEYSRTVQALEAGNTDIDYKKFRESFLDSPQFLKAGKQREKFDKLKDEMYKQMDKSQFKKIIKTTKQMLSIDYTSMLAHKILRQTYQILEDTTNAKKYKTIQFGLLYSIINTGDGKSCASSWEVIQISEEYFILQILGAKLIKQSIDNSGGLCDKMVVNIEGTEKTYFFDISKIMDKSSKLLKKNE